MGACNALEASENRVHSVTEHRETPGGNAMETARIEELLIRLVEQNTELIDKISELLQEVQDIKEEMTATNAEVIQSLFKIEQSTGKA
jgi:hypothetical protein